MSAIRRLVFFQETDYDLKFENGVLHFQTVFKFFMDRNNFSHPGMANLAKLNLCGASWLHSSQISGLRHAKLKSPGPKVFAAIAHLNAALHDYKEHKRLIPGTGSSHGYHEPFVILLDDGSVPTPGWWYSLFIGDVTCETIDFSVPTIDLSDASNISRRTYKYIKSLADASNRDLLDVFSSYLHEQDINEGSDTGRILDKFISSGTIAPTDLAANFKFIAGICGKLGGPATSSALLDLVE